MPTEILFPGSSLRGQQAAESQGRLVNVYGEPEQGQIVYKRIPGTSFFTDLQVSSPRGMIESDGFVYAAYDSIVKRISSDGTHATLVGALPGTTKVTWAKNNQVASGRNIVVVTDGGVYNVTATNVFAFGDPDLPANPTSCFGLDGYIGFTYGNGDIWATGLNDITVNGLSRARAEANPDGVLRGIVSGRQLFAMGQASIEVWQNAGTTPFPFARTAVIPVGLLSTFAVAGGNESDGWDSGPLFVAMDGTVRQLQGYEPTIVSTRAVERAIAADHANLEAYVYTFLGHSIWGLKASSFCWEYNTSTGKWHERQSKGSDTWRGSRTVLAFNNQWLVGDTGSRELRVIDRNAKSEHGTDLVCTLESGAMKNFPGRLVVARADFKFGSGVGMANGTDLTQTDPRVAVSWSNDGGATWGNELHRPLGLQGQYGNLVRVNRTGITTANGRRWRLRVSDPVDFIFYAGTMEIEERPA